MQRSQLLCAALLAMSTLQITDAQSAASPSASSYRIIAQYPIGGNDAGYDYLRVDTPTRRVFVAHADRVEVLNVDGGKKLGEITGMHGVHAIELIPELGKGAAAGAHARAVR